MHVITPNKQMGAGSLDAYQHVQQTLKTPTNEPPPRFLYEVRQHLPQVGQRL